MDSRESNAGRLLAETLLRGVERPILLLDWSKVTDGFHALTTSVAFQRRSFVLYSEVHPEDKLGDKKVQKRYLKALEDILPNGYKPILVFDAGFGHEFRDLKNHRFGWSLLHVRSGSVKRMSVLKSLGRSPLCSE